MSLCYLQYLRWLHFPCEEINYGEDRVMPKVVSIINLKGGVGKTTLTVALADFTAVNFPGKKVLVIDLDPQSNTSVALLGEERWFERVQLKRTLFNLFKDKLDDTENFSFEDSIVTKASNIDGGLGNLHVLPSSLEFISIQDRMINISETAMMRPVDVLEQAAGRHLENYDLVLIDCPPSLGLVTRNGLMLSDYYLIPVIADRLSTWGIPEILSEIRTFKKKTHARLEPMGIVVTMYRSNVIRHKATVEELNANHETKGWPKLFKSRIPLAAKMADTTDWDAPNINTLKQKYGWGGAEPYDSLVGIMEEFKEYVFKTD
jgi:chromosome partitioning protein